MIRYSFNELALALTSLPGTRFRSLNQRVVAWDFRCLGTIDELGLLDSRRRWDVFV